MRNRHVIDESFFPDTPKITNFTVSALTTTSATLSWIKPAGNIDYYLVGYRAIIVNPINISSSELHPQTHISGMTQGELYSLRIQTFYRGASTSTYFNVYASKFLLSNMHLASVPRYYPSGQN